MVIWFITWLDILAIMCNCLNTEYRIFLFLWPFEEILSTCRKSLMLTTQYFRIWAHLYRTKLIRISPGMNMSTMVYMEGHICNTYIVPRHCVVHPHFVSSWQTGAIGGRALQKIFQTSASCIQPQFLGLWASGCENADWLQITPAW